METKLKPRSRSGSTRKPETKKKSPVHEMQEYLKSKPEIEKPPAVSWGKLSRPGRPRSRKTTGPSGTRASSVSSVSSGPKPRPRKTREILTDVNPSEASYRELKYEPRKDYLRLVANIKTWALENNVYDADVKRNMKKIYTLFQEIMTLHKKFVNWK